MRREVYRYRFRDSVDLEDVEASLLLALLGVEAIHGETQVRLDAAHAFDAARRACVIDASTTVGRDINRLFLGYLRRELSDGQFTVKRRDKASSNEPVGE